MSYRPVTIAVALALLVAATAAQADYVLTPLSSGGGSATIGPGDTLALDLVLTSNGADVQTSAVFDVVFSAPGLRFDGYIWRGNYGLSGGDNSDPQLGALPLAITAATHGDASSPIDLHFENFTFAGFGTGTLLTLSLSVPADFAPVPQSVSIQAVPDTFSGSGGDIPATAGPAFSSEIVPEPSTLTLLGVGALGLLAYAWRRRKPCV